MDNPWIKWRFIAGKIIEVNFGISEPCLIAEGSSIPMIFPYISAMLVSHKISSYKFAPAMMVGFQDFSPRFPNKKPGQVCHSHDHFLWCLHGAPEKNEFAKLVSNSKNWLVLWHLNSIHGYQFMIWLGSFS